MGFFFFWTASYHPTNKLNGQTNSFWGSPTLRKPKAKVMAKKLSLNFQERGPWCRSPKWLMQKKCCRYIPELEALYQTDTILFDVICILEARKISKVCNVQAFVQPM